MTHVPRIPARPEPDADGGAGPWSAAGGSAAGDDHSPDPRPLDPLPPPPSQPVREPVFTLPGTVMAMAGIMVGVQLVRSAIPFPWDLNVLVWFAFIPVRYTTEYTGLPGGLAADVWTFFTYALLHGSWMHLLSNAFCLVAFGTPVARRFGAARFWTFSAVAAAGGAAVHLAVHPYDMAPVVGASAAIAGMMAAAARFVFDAGGPLAGLRRPHDPAAYRRPARSLGETMTNRSVIVFVALFLFMNIAIGLAGSAVIGQAIAWEAHLGGFLIGLFAFRVFDPVPKV
jgi:membrane associated rhomboid family serine protease